MKSTSFPYEPYAICENAAALWFSLVVVQLFVAWLSRSPADPALILPPISFNKLTQAQTWDNSSYSVPSEGDSDNGRWLCTFSSVFSLISQWICWTLFCAAKVDCVLHAWYTRWDAEQVSRQWSPSIACELFSRNWANYSLLILSILIWVQIL